MGKEFEVKLHVDSENQLEQVLAWTRLQPLRTGELVRYQMKTTYFDTADSQLAARKWTLRRRLENGRSVICMKTAGTNESGISHRGEWQLEGENVLAALPALIAQGAPEALASLCAKGLTESCGAEFLRRAVPLTLDGCTCELAGDSGVLRGGNTQQPFWEIELELKDGSPEPMLALCGALERTFGLAQEPKSKFARAQALRQI